MKKSAGNKKTREPAKSAVAKEDWRDSNIGRLLNRCVTRFETRVLEHMAGEGFPNVRLTHIKLTRSLDIKGTAIMEIARRSAVSKQAMGQLVDQCEELGLVKRYPHPTDKRTVLVKFSALGLRWLNAFRVALERTEREMEVQLGTELVENLRSNLQAYADAPFTKTPVRQRNKRK